MLHKTNRKKRNGVRENSHKGGYSSVWKIAFDAIDSDKESWRIFPINQWSP